MLCKNNFRVDAECQTFKKSLQPKQYKTITDSKY